MKLLWKYYFIRLAVITTITAIDPRAKIHMHVGRSVNDTTNLERNLAKFIKSNIPIPNDTLKTFYIWKPMVKK